MLGFGEAVLSHLSTSWRWTRGATPRARARRRRCARAWTTTIRSARCSCRTLASRPSSPTPSGSARRFSCPRKSSPDPTTSRPRSSRAGSAPAPSTSTPRPPSSSSSRSRRASRSSAWRSDTTPTPRGTRRTPDDPLPRFRLGLDTELAFERRGLVASVADSRAKTDAALRRRDRLLRLAEARLAAMERAEAETDASTETEIRAPPDAPETEHPPAPTRRSTSSPPRESPRTSSSTTAPPPPSPPSTRRSNPRTSPLPCLTTTRASLSPARVSERSRPASIPPPGRPSPTNFENCSSRRITRRIIDVTTSRGPRTRRRGRVARRTARGMKFA